MKTNLKKSIIDIIEDGDDISKIEIFVKGRKSIVFELAPVTERIKSYEDACIEMSISPNHKKFDNMKDDEVAYYKLKIITKAINEGWKPDWINKLQPKWYPWFDIIEDIHHNAYLFANGATRPSSPIGSSLCFKTKELAEYAGNQFKELYEIFLL